MSIRLSLPPAVLPFVLAAATFGAWAQAPSPGEPQSTAARDNMMIESSFSQADANNDGKLSRDEVVKMPAVAAKFDDLDRDKDGMLSLEEFAAAVSGGT